MDQTNKIHSGYRSFKLCIHSKFFMRIISAVSFYTLYWMPIPAAAALELCKAVSFLTFSTAF